MEPSAVETDWSRLSEVIADAMGLHFPRERWPDLQRGLAGATTEFGFTDIAACAESLLSAPLTKIQMQVLADHLTIGETYFFREKRTFEAIASQLLPALIESRRNGERRLRLWSAACCTGEEAYSLAIMLHQLLPDLAAWHVTILATDINARFLRKAVAASYGEWSFRDAPAGFKERYFIRGEDNRYLVVPEIRQMVTFAPLNLAEGGYPSLATDTNAMDLIFCRNVLMYFAPAQAVRVIANLRHALIDGGWLAVGPSEVSQALFPGFVVRNFPGVILYQKGGAPLSSRPQPRPKLRGETERLDFAPALPWPRPAAPVPAATRAPAPRSEREEKRPRPYELARALYEQGRQAEAVETLLVPAARAMRDPREFHLLARALANEGKLTDALAWCDSGLVADKLDAVGHYLRATILLEQGQVAPARISLQRAVYLDPAFVLAHFALGNLARANGKPGEADRHFSNAQQLLVRLKADEPIPEGDGLTAGRLAEIIATLATLKTSR
ncbi:MAG: methyltransferase, CheR-type [Verrucomicrobia bacterium]|nr:methyltransferase, CheR-type [Verrucomicrobiota bacterium]